MPMPAQDPTTTQVQLAILDQILTEIERQKAQARPGPKEAPVLSPDISPAEAAMGVQAVEQEQTPEIGPEVESFLEHQQDHPDQLPEEIVIADDQQLSKSTHFPKKPVIVLPITPEIEKKGHKKNPKFSIRWLVEWSIRIIKKFTGKVIYRDAQ